MRLLARIVSALLILSSIAALLLGWTLFEAHRQIRAVDPPLPSAGELHRAVAVADAPLRVRYVNSASQPTADGRTMGHPAFVLDWADGRRFLIDAGMEPDVALEFGRPMEIALGFGSAVAHGAVADQLGADAEPIAGLAFTHLHHDHTQGIVALCRLLGRALPIHQTPWQLEQRNHTTDMGFVFIEEARALSETSDCATSTRLPEGSMTSIHEIPGFPGLVAIPAGGHTPGSTLYLARIADHHWLFSGDVTNSRPELIDNVPKAAIYSLLIVPENTHRLARLRLWLAALDTEPDWTVVVSHDLTALEATSIAAWSEEKRP